MKLKLLATGFAGWLLRGFIEQQIIQSVRVL